MKLQVQSYNNGGAAYNAEAEETAFLSYRIVHRFNEPAEAIITIADPTGTKAQKYNVDANDVYVGPGKVTIEDPDATDVFYGRIMRAEADTVARTVTLYAEDWLSQLNEEQILYDMREDLDGSGLRESTIYPDIGDTDGNGVYPAVTTGIGGAHIYDNRMSWAANLFNNMYLVLTGGMAGTNTWGTCPYDEVVTGDGGGIDSDIGDETDLWVDDNNSHAVWDNDENWTQDYYFRIYVGNDTASAFYVDDSISAATIDVTYVFKDDDADATCEVQIYCDSDDDGTLDTWATVGQLPTYDAQLGHYYSRASLPVPAEYFNGVTNDNVVGSDGVAKVRLNVTKGTSNAYLYVYYIRFNVTVDTTGFSAADKILATTNGNRLSTQTYDFSTAAYQVWEVLPYSIGRPIYKHIDSAETPGTLITDGDIIETLTCAATIEHTSGVSTRQYKNKTRLEIIQDLAKQDKAEFWVSLGTTTVNYKSTWNDGAPETLTDTDVNSWLGTFDYSRLANEFNVYGMRIGDTELYSNVTDATSIGKYIATRSQTHKGTGLVSEADTKAYATALVNQYANVQQIVMCTIRGNTAKVAHAKTLVLGDEVSITSTYLGLSADVYIVQRWEYDADTNLTTMLLHPRVSQTGLQREDFGSAEQAMQAFRRGDPDRYVPKPADDVV